MKKNTIIILGVVLLILTTIISIIFINRENLKETIFDKPKEEKKFEITLEDETCNSKEIKLYTYDEGNSLYSRCGEVFYTESDKDKMTLADALSKKYITIKEITDKMEAIEAIYDGGTVVYEYKENTNDLSKNKFRLEVCHKTNGSRDQLFLSTESTDYKCLK